MLVPKKWSLGAVRLELQDTVHYAIQPAASCARCRRAHAARANEGGERVLAKSHLQVQSALAEAAARPLRATGHSYIDGVQPVIVHLSGHSVAIVAFYAFPYSGLAGGHSSQ
eukprot:5802036-Pyramimonas_sp.AAC.1